jgi:S-DNA-T family DNA segregation ATPase FtsK/SpoIIIE
MNKNGLLALMWVGLVLFYDGSLAFYSPLDPAFNSISVPPLSMGNPMGVIGANLSAGAVYAFGVGAFFLPLWLHYLLSFFWFRRIKYLYLSVLLFLWVSCLCVVAEKVWRDVVFFQYPLRMGGWYGFACARELVGYVGTVGAWFLLVGIFLGTFVLYGGRLIGKEITWNPFAWLAWFPRRQKKMPSKGTLKTTKLPVSSHPIFFLDFAKMRSFLAKGKAVENRERDRFCGQSKETLLATLKDFGITGTISDYVIGPVVTVFEFRPSQGTKQAKVLGISEELALALKVDAVLIAPIAAKQALGIQVPNRVREAVLLGDVIKQPTEARLPFYLGKSVSGDIVIEDLTQMPHLLIAGSTGSGKSIAINTLICSILLNRSPMEVRLLLIDPKILELSLYEGIPHLLCPVISDPQASVNALAWMVEEMERRYALLKKLQVRNIESFNEKLQERMESHPEQTERRVGVSFSKPLPYLLVVIDELADLMLSTSRQIEVQIQRLAQKARASGIHIVVATQRPSVDVITGVIKANFPSRLSFRVASRHDSRTILDAQGAEKLLGKGDLLFQKPGELRTVRAQGAYVSEEEVLSIATYLKRHPQAHLVPRYDVTPSPASQEEGEPVREF